MRREKIRKELKMLEEIFKKPEYIYFGEEIRDEVLKIIVKIYNLWTLPYQGYLTYAGMARSTSFAKIFSNGIGLLSGKFPLCLMLCAFLARLCPF